MSKLLSRFGSKKDLTQPELKCAIRLLDDDEVLHTSFQVGFTLFAFLNEL